MSWAFARLALRFVAVSYHKDLVVAGSGKLFKTRIAYIVIDLCRKWPIRLFFPNNIPGLI